MRAVTRWQADDGTLWRTPGEAEERDDLIRECEAVADEIGLRPRSEDTGYSNGGGYVQQPTGSRERLLGWLREKGATRDSTGPLGKVLWRLQCIDDNDREWGQPFFALNPDKGEQVAL